MLKMSTLRSDILPTVVAFCMCEKDKQHKGPTEKENY